MYETHILLKHDKPELRNFSKYVDYLIPFKIKIIS